MAKTLWLVAAPALTHLGTNNALLSGTTIGWQSLLLSEARGADTTGTAVTAVSTTVAGPTNGIEVLIPASYNAEWISEPLAADFTISGTITLNLWARESTTAANAAINAAIDKIDAKTGVLTRIATSARVTELGTTAAAANFTVTPTSTACNRGDRLRVRVFADDAGTMATGLTVTFNYDRSTAAQGESFVTFTENLTFAAAGDPTGTTYYLTDAASAVDPGSATEKDASRSRGAGSVDSVTNTVNGWTAGIQVTDSAGGTAIEWYTPPLNAVTLGGKSKFNIRAKSTGPPSTASLKAEFAVVANDGSSPVVWGVACIQPLANFGFISNTTDTAYVAWVGGDDVAVTAGQRLRFRIYLDDGSDVPLFPGQTVTVSYNGAVAAAAGDTYVILPVTVGQLNTKTGNGRENG